MEKKTKRFTIILTVIYSVMVVWIILFKMCTLSELASLDYIRNINLIPFYYDEERAYHLSEVMDNVAIFVPFGVYLKMLKFKNTEVIICGAGFSLTLEILQFVLGIGATDITDVITNTLGTAVGVSLYCILELVFKKNEKFDKALNILASICTLLLITFVALIFLSN